MKKSNLISALTVFLFLVSYNFCLAAESQPVQEQNRLSELYEILDSGKSTHSFSSATLLAKDSDRGCCVWKTGKSKCAFTNEGYCKYKAKEANVKFEFYKDVPCKGLPVCK